MQPVAPARQQQWLVKQCQWWGLLPRPPLINGVAVEPIVDEGSSVPTISYLGNFWALRAHTSPKQVNVEFNILLAEMAVMWGGLWLVAKLTGIDNVNPVAPVVNANGGLVKLPTENVFWHETLVI